MTSTRERTNEMTAIIKELRPIRTLEETAEIMGVRYQTVQHIERNAIWKICQRLRDLTRAAIPSVEPG